MTSTYEKIRESVIRWDGFSPKDCWIADVLSEHGLTTRIAYNRLDPSMRANPCPRNKRKSIIDALYRLGDIKKGS